jgi:O-acetylhomoserine/O-acetylserine sulfhydrylase-like pyridoxal-dependent enzyme
MTRRRINESYRNSVEGPTYQSASYYFDNAEHVRHGLHERSVPAGRYGRYSNPSWLEVERMRLFRNEGVAVGASMAG